MSVYPENFPPFINFGDGGWGRTGDWARLPKVAVFVQVAITFAFSLELSEWVYKI